MVRRFPVMHRLHPTDRALARALLRAESRRSPQAAFLHRLHCVALVAAGHGCEAVAAAFGDDERSVQRWVRRFEASGAEGLTQAPRSGRPARLGEAEFAALRQALAEAPSTFGHAGPAWSAEMLRCEVERRYGIAYTRRHCARLLGRLAAAGTPPDPREIPQHSTALMSHPKRRR